MPTSSSSSSSSSPTKKLAEKPAIVKEVKKFCETAKKRWMIDPEVWHFREFHVRTKVIEAIADGSLKGEYAEKTCGYLAGLAKDPDLQRWFA